MTTPARPSAPRRLGGGPLGILLGTLATLAFVPVLDSLFGLVGLGIPCEGFLCSIGLALYGAIAGAALGLVLGGVAGWFCGLRWWFIPGFVLGVVAGGMAFSALAIPIESSWPWLLPILPLAAVLASGLPTRPRLLASGILGAVLVLGVGVGVFVVGRTSAVAAASRAVAAARTDGVGILAPVGHDEFVVSAVVHEPPPTGPAQEIVDEAADRQQYKQKPQRCKLHGSSLLSLVWWVQDPGSGAPQTGFPRKFKNQLPAGALQASRKRFQFLRADQPGQHARQGVGTQPLW